MSDDFNDEDLKTRYLDELHHRTRVSIADVVVKATDDRLKRILSIMSEASTLGHMDKHDRHIVENSYSRIVDGWNGINILLTAFKNLDSVAYPMLAESLSELVLGLVSGVSRATTSKSARKFFVNRPFEIARDNKGKNDKPRYDAVTEAVIAAAGEIKAGIRYPSTGKLADALYPSVRKYLKRRKAKTSPTTIKRRLEELFEIKELSRSILIDRDE